MNWFSGPVLYNALPRLRKPARTVRWLNLEWILSVSFNETGGHNGSDKIKARLLEWFVAQLVGHWHTKPNHGWIQYDIASIWPDGHDYFVDANKLNWLIKTLLFSWNIVVIVRPYCHLRIPCSGPTCVHSITILGANWKLYFQLVGQP